MAASGTSLCDIRGIGPIGAAIILGAVGDISRFPTAGHFASYNATAPIDASSSNHTRHRLNPRGNRKLNLVLHVAAVCQLQHGGDLDQPVTFTGHSLGAQLAYFGGLNEAKYSPGGTYDLCLSGAPRPDVIVPIAGCHYEFRGDQYGLDLTELTNWDVKVVLVAGSDDTVCEPWQSRDAIEGFQTAGDDVSLVEIAGANHYHLIFHDIVDGEWMTLPDNPAGEEVVQTILNAIASTER